MARHSPPVVGTHQWFDTFGDVGGRLNWLRAAVLGANDGIVSMAGLLIGGVEVMNAPSAPPWKPTRAITANTFSITNRRRDAT